MIVGSDGSFEVAGSTDGNGGERRYYQRRFVRLCCLVVRDQINCSYIQAAMLILGISAFFHDSAAAIVRDGRGIAAAQEERFTRVKNDAAFPIQAIAYCLEFAGCTLDELDALVFYDKPLLKLERILESYHSEAPRGWGSFLRWMPVWMKQKMMLKKVIRDELEGLGPYDRRKLTLLFSEHHLSHAASAFYC